MVRAKVRVRIRNEDEYVVIGDRRRRKTWSGTRGEPRRSMTRLRRTYKVYILLVRRHSLLCYS